MSTSEQSSYFMCDIFPCSLITCVGECTPTVPNATDCAIVQSSIYLTANVGHEEEARASALHVIHHRLERGSYEQGTILRTSYLGPDLDRLNMFRSEQNNGSLNEGSASSSSGTPTTFYIAIGVVSLAVCALVAFLVMTLRVRRERKRLALASIAGATVPSSHRSAMEMIVDDLHIPYSSSPSPRSQGHHDRRSLLRQGRM